VNYLEINGWTDGWICRQLNPKFYLYIMKFVTTVHD